MVHSKYSHRPTPCVLGPRHPRGERAPSPPSRRTASPTLLSREGRSTQKATSAAKQRNQPQKKQQTYLYRMKCARLGKSYGFSLFDTKRRWLLVERKALPQPEETGRGGAGRGGAVGPGHADRNPLHLHSRSAAGVRDRRPGGGAY